MIEDKGTSTYGYIGYQPNLEAIFVTFRGSEDLNNWLTNLDILTTAYPYCSGCEVHAGFYSAQQKVIQGIMNEVKSLKARFPSYTVVATGHSLGAALATLTAIDFMQAGLSPVKLFNYGSPRVGTKPFADWVSNDVEQSKVLVTRTTHYKGIFEHFFYYGLFPPQPLSPHASTHFVWKNFL